jgi:hypothetical protein
MTSTHTYEELGTVGTYRLCAWATSETSCRVQTNNPAIAKALRKFPDCEQVGFSAQGYWVRIFSLPYTLAWVRKNVVEKLTLEFPLKNEGEKSEFGPGGTGAVGRGGHSKEILGMDGLGRGRGLTGSKGATELA